MPCAVTVGYLFGFTGGSGGGGGGGGIGHTQPKKSSSHLQQAPVGLREFSGHAVFPSYLRLGSQQGTWFTPPQISGLAFKHLFGGAGAVRNGARGYALEIATNRNGNSVIRVISISATLYI